MFKKKAFIENIYDREYKFLHETLFAKYNALNEAIHVYHIKEIKAKLFPKNTESYTIAIQELEAAQMQILTCKLNYKVALEQEQKYYTENHEHFVACKNYIEPNKGNCTVDEVIEYIIAREF